MIITVVCLSAARLLWEVMRATTPRAASSALMRHETRFSMLRAMLPPSGIVGYVAAYLNTPRDLRVHLATSVDRLLLQLWPSALFVFFLIASPPHWTPAAQENTSSK